MGEKSHPHLEFLKAEVVWTVKYEMARTVEDGLARRVRILFLDAITTRELAPEVAKILGYYLCKDEAWQQDQIAKFSVLAEHYILRKQKQFLKKAKTTLKLFGSWNESFCHINFRQMKTPIFY